MVRDIKKALEKMYIDRCDIILRVKVKDSSNGRVNFEEKTVYKDVPCRLSRPTTTGNTASTNSMVTTLDAEFDLFMATEVEVKEGSKIVVNHIGKTEVYDRSGIPARYQSHQEIPVKPWKQWA